MLFKTIDKYFYINPHQPIYADKLKNNPFLHKPLPGFVQ